jgi:hypothetical protein
MTFLEIQNAVYRLMRDPSKTKFDLQSIKDRINEGEQRYCILTKYSLKKDTTIQTVIGTDEYNLPADYGTLDAAYYNGNQLYQIALEDTIWPNAKISTPISYYLRNAEIGLYPIPDAQGTLTLIYHSIGGEMADDTDHPVIPVEDQYLLVEYASYKCAKEGDDSRQTTFLQEWTNGILQAIRTNVDKNFTSFPTVGDQYSDYHFVDRDLTVL